MNKTTEINHLRTLGPYKEKKRFKGELQEIGGKFMQDISSEFNGFDKKINEIYRGYESNPTNPLDKLPNLTLLWNLQFENKGYMYASSIGHVHPPERFDVQEIYEFHNYGALLISTKDRVSLHICKPRDKVFVPPDCIMTIFSLSHQRLLTLDMANPLTNSSSKELIKLRKGPMMAIYNSRRTIRIKLNPNYPVFETIVPVELELKADSKESGLYETILENKKEFEKYHIEVLASSRNLKCRGRDSRNYSFNKGLLELVLDANKPVHRCLGII